MDSIEVTKFKEARLGDVAASLGAFDVHHVNSPARDPRGRFIVVLRDAAGSEPLGEVIGHTPPERNSLARWTDAWISQQQEYVGTVASRATSAGLRAHHDLLLSRLRRVEAARSQLGT